MRTELKQLGCGGRFTFRAMVKKVTYARIRGRNRKMVILRHIQYGKRIVTGHLWMQMGETFKGLDIKRLQLIEFEAEVCEYVKGYVGPNEDVNKPLQIDYCLRFPSNIKIISNNYRQFKRSQRNKSIENPETNQQSKENNDK